MGFRNRTKRGTVERAVARATQQAIDRASNMSRGELKVWIEATAMNVDRCMSEYTNTGQVDRAYDAHLYAQQLCGMLEVFTSGLLTD